MFIQWRLGCRWLPAQSRLVPRRASYVCGAGAPGRRPIGGRRMSTGVGLGSQLTPSWAASLCLLEGGEAVLLQAGTGDRWGLGESREGGWVEGVGGQKRRAHPHTSDMATSQPSLPQRERNGERAQHVAQPSVRAQVLTNTQQRRTLTARGRCGPATPQAPAASAGCGCCACPSPWAPPPPLPPAAPRPAEGLGAPLVNTSATTRNHSEQPTGDSAPTRPPVANRFKAY